MATILCKTDIYLAKKNRLLYSHASEITTIVLKCNSRSEVNSNSLADQNQHEGIHVLKLVVVTVFPPELGMPDKVFNALNSFNTSEQAERRALRWLEHRPNDIVMLVES